MPPKRMKPVTVDTMVHYVIQKYKIPTRKDVDKINRRLDSIERLLQDIAKSTSGAQPLKRSQNRKRDGGAQGRTTATDVILEILRKANKEVSLEDIKKRSGFNDKKVRNIIFRMHKLGKIERADRGVYKISK